MAVNPIKLLNIFGHGTSPANLTGNTIFKFFYHFVDLDFIRIRSFYVFLINHCITKNLMDKSKTPNGGKDVCTRV